MDQHRFHVISYPDVKIFSSVFDIPSHQLAANAEGRMCTCKGLQGHSLFAYTFMFVDECSNENITLVLPDM